MLQAVLAGVIAIVLAIVIISVVFVVVSRNRSGKVSAKKSISQIDALGVGDKDATKPEKRSGKGARTSSSQVAAANPADTLKSRFTALGILTAAIFGTLTAKVWSLQVLAHSSYSQASSENLYTTVSTPAPRGYICDAFGKPLVKNRTCNTVLADPDVLNNHDVVSRLSAVLGLPANIVRTRIMDSTGGAQSQRVVASDVRTRDVAFIAEHADAFDGVTVEARTVRQYPYGALAAHILGYTGTPSEDELEIVHEGRTVKSSDTVGKTGVESYYDDLLAGDHGQRRVTVDAEGNVLDVVSETKATRGSDLYLSVRAPVQYALDAGLAALVAPDGNIGSGKGIAAAAVVMDLSDGGVLGMASYPTYDPSNFIGGIPQETWDLYNTETAHYPLQNRAMAGEYAAASTFKAFTSLAGLKYGFADDKKTWNCQGTWDGFGSGDWQDCWLLSGHGELSLHEGIVQSCDVVFYEMGKDFFDHGPDGSGPQANTISETALQDELFRFGFGSKTGIDLDGEAVGRVPTPAWKAEHWRNVPSEANWKGGDFSNMMIGQGNVLITPIQLAVAYGAIATGKFFKPHLLKEVRNAEGQSVVSVKPEYTELTDVKKEHLELVRNALRGVVTEHYSYDVVFQEYGIEAAGKTGTAEHTTGADDGWFVCYAPYDNPKYVAACIVERDGAGASDAMPILAAALGAAFETDADPNAGAVGRVAGSTGKESEKKNNDAETSTSRTD